MTYAPQSWRGRGRGHGRFPYGSSTRGGWSSNSASNLATPPSPEPPLGSLLSSLTKDDFDDDAEKHEHHAAISDFKTVASYNWLDRSEPTIAVPGKPPRWTPLASPRRLKLDDGEFFRDPNSAQFPKHPMEPAVVAAVTMQPDISRHTDIVACGSTIGNLLRFVLGEDKPFRILVELVGDTVFFVRRENTPRELIPDVKGYGHTFPEAYTTWDKDVKGSIFHQRIVSYRFGGLGFLVRFKGDGYIASDDEDDDSSDGEDAASMTPGWSAGRPNPSAEVGLLVAELERNSVASNLPDATNSELTVVRAGTLVSQARLFELKTRSVRKKEHETFEVLLADQLTRLWAAQIPNFVLAYHTGGVFHDVEVTSVRPQVDGWEARSVAVLARLAALLHQISGLVRARRDRKLELRLAAGVLEVREQLADAGEALSSGAKDLWREGGEQADRESLSLGGSGPDSGEDDDDDGLEEGVPDGDWDSKSEPDYTACSADHCGYCGRCSY